MGTLCISLTCGFQFQVTGSGKTLAFLIPIVEILLRRSLALDIFIFSLCGN